jgi:hypothetical protein
MRFATLSTSYKNCEMTWLAFCAQVDTEEMAELARIRKQLDLTLFSCSLWITLTT